MKRFIQEVLGGLSLAGLYLLMPSGEGVVLAFPVALVAAGVGLASSFMGNKGASNAAKEYRTHYNRRLDIGNLIKDIGKMLPGLRELQATGAIPGFQSAAATANARSGLTGTGLGNALSTAAGGAGEMEAIKQAIEAALAHRGQNAKLAFPGPTGVANANSVSALNAIQKGLLNLNEQRNAFNTNAMNLPGQPTPGTIPTQQIGSSLPAGADFNFPTGR